MIKRTAVRGVRKTAHLTRRVLSVGANYSGKVENKAHRIINGMDDTIKLHDKVLFEKLYYESLPYVTPVHPALPTVGRSGHVSLLIPSLQKSSFFGGTATALIFAGLTAEKLGMDLVIMETLKKGRARKSDLRAFFKDNKVPFKHNIKLVDLSPRKYNNYGYIGIHPDDVFICSAWWDAYILEKLPLTKKFIYLIQDYEPIFYNNSDLRVLAESTYMSDKFVPVCNTKLMLEHMADHGYTSISKNGVCFEPAVNAGKKVGIAKDAPKGRKTLFVYGRPSVERNLFFTALKSLDEAFTRNVLDPDEWDCYMAGQDGLSTIVLKSGVEIKPLGKMSMCDYYEFAKQVDLAVSLMLAPHPSYPPLELASLGAAVVTTKYMNKQDLTGYSKNIIASGTSVDELVQSISQATRIDPAARKKNAEDSSISSDWRKALENVVNHAVKQV